MPLFHDIVHKALASEIRRKIILAISEKEKYLTEIAGEIGKQPQTIDFHLNLLVEIGLVSSEWRNGKKYYFLKNKEIIKFLRERRPVPGHVGPKPPHEIVQDMWDEMNKRLDRIEKKIDSISKRVKKV